LGAEPETTGAPGRRPTVSLGYDRPLYLLAFDHRGSFEKGLFGTQEPVSPQVKAGIIDAKELIFDAHLEVVKNGLVPAAAAGVLVDEEFGASVARKAKEEGTPLAMPVERSGQDEFQFEYGDDFGQHIEAFDPTFTKVLVRYNPEGDVELNKRQSERLARLSQWLREHERKFLFELLVPPTTEQLDRYEDTSTYDKELRPSLVVEVIHTLQTADVEPDVWKIEGLDLAEDCQKVVTQARGGGRDGVACIILGRGADEAKVFHWLRVAASVRGFNGFAVGRTIWYDALEEFLAGQISRDDAVQNIARRYKEMYDTYVAAT
jgi:myo-inositol catabolism protein IolC